MKSWRDTASAAAQEDLDNLLNAVLPLAQGLLGKNGQFYPFAASVSASGEVSVAAADQGSGDRRDPAQVLVDLYEAARATAADNRASAFVVDVLANGSDAVQVELEHRDGIALVVLVPYKPSTLNRVPKFEQMSAAPGEPRIWVEG